MRRRHLLLLDGGYTKQSKPSNCVVNRGIRSRTKDDQICRARYNYWCKIVEFSRHLCLLPAARPQFVASTQTQEMRMLSNNQYITEAPRERIDLGTNVHRLQPPEKPCFDPHKVQRAFESKICRELDRVLLQRRTLGKKN